MEACKYHTSNKQQGIFRWDLKFDVQSPTSLFQQLEDDKNHGVVICAAIERIDYFSGWTSIIQGRLG